MTATTVGNFRLIEQIGEGGMGEVYRGFDTMLEREVAIKTLRPEIAARPDLVERFRIEAIALAKLSHPNIATVYSFFRDGSQFHMAMQFVRGRTLEQLLAQQKRFDWEDSVRVAADVLHALSHAHAMGVIHRDLKPANLMREDSGRTVVMDFGIARMLARTRQTRSGNIVGTMEYIAPELIKGADADARSDIYSLGVVLYELVCGRLPFEGRTDYELMRAHAELVPPSPLEFRADLPPALAELILRALAKAPDARFQSATEFLAALSEKTTVPITTITPLPVHPRPLRRSSGGRQRFDALLHLPTASLRGAKEWLQGVRARPSAASSASPSAPRVVGFAKENPGVAIAAIAGLAAIGFTGAGIYKSTTAPTVPSVKPAASVIVVPKIVAPTPAPIAPQADSKGTGMYQVPPTPQPNVSIETPDRKTPEERPAEPPRNTEPAAPKAPPATQGVQGPRPPAPPAAKPAPKPPAATPPTAVATKPASPEKKEAKDNTPPNPSGSGWTIRR